MEGGHIDCLDDHGQGECSGPVEFRTTPDRDDFRSFPRCEAHFDKRLAAAERTADLRGDCPPRWFDPAYAGERWDEE